MRFIAKLQGAKDKEVTIPTESSSDAINAKERDIRLLNGKREPDISKIMRIMKVLVFSQFALPLRTK